MNFPIICYDLTPKDYLINLESIINDINQNLPGDRQLDVNEGLSFYSNSPKNIFPMRPYGEGTIQSTVAEDQEIIDNCDAIYQQLLHFAKIDPIIFSEKDQRLVPIDSSLESIQSAIRLQPNNALLFEMLFDISVNNQDIENTIYALNQLIQLNSSNIKIPSTYFDIIVQNGRIEECFHSISKLVSVQPSFTNSHLHFLLLLKKMSRQNAILQFSNLYLTHCTFHHWKLIYHIGQILRMSGFIEESIKALQKADSLFPKQASILVALADINQKIKNREDSQKYLDMAITIDPRHPDVLRCEGDFYMRKQQHELAIDHYYLAIKNGTISFAPYMRLVKMLKKFGRNNEAKEVYQIAKNRCDISGESRINLKKLEEILNVN